MYRLVSLSCKQWLQWGSSQVNSSAAVEGVKSLAFVTKNQTCLSFTSWIQHFDIRCLKQHITVLSFVSSLTHDRSQLILVLWCEKQRAASPYQRDDRTHQPQPGLASLSLIACTPHSANWRASPGAGTEAPRLSLISKQSLDADLWNAWALQGQRSQSLHGQRAERCICGD